MSEAAQIEKGLKHLAGSEEIIGNIVAYCVNAYKADPSATTMNKIRQYVTDTANSVCGHVLTIAHNINSIIDKETKEIEEMSYQIGYCQHRLQSHQTYMSELYMTKFQTLPRPKHTIHILRQTIPTEQLPKYARPKKPWVRHGVFDYSILDSVGSDKPRRKQQTQRQGEGGRRPKNQHNKAQTNHAIAPKAAVQAFNPYESMMQKAPQVDANAPPVSMSSAATGSSLSPSSPKSVGGYSSKSLYQQQKERKAALKKTVSTNKVINAPPPSFSGAAPPSFSGASIGAKKKAAQQQQRRPQQQQQKRPQQPKKMAKAPPSMSGGPPPSMSAAAQPKKKAAGGPPPSMSQAAPPSMSGAGGPPPIPYAAPGGGGGPPPNPMSGGPPPNPMGGAGPPPVPMSGAPPIPPVPMSGGPPPVPMSGGPPVPPQPPQPPKPPE